MNAVTSSAAPVTGPFFHEVDGSERFCFFHAAGGPGTARGCVLAVHAFAEEMNKTRAAAAEGARALAASGLAVLQIDLVGCGDSAGEFEDATWAAWLSDLEAAWSWLAVRCTGPRWLWGTRLGALLADRFAITAVPRPDGLLLWQPVVNGAQHLGQFLRLKTVNTMLREPLVAGPADESRPVARVAQQSPRADLAAGRSIEVAGYRLTPSLADSIEAARLGASMNATVGVPVAASLAEGAWTPPRVRWFEVSSQPEPTLSPVAAKVVERWRGAGSDVAVAHVAGPAFWQTQESERCPALVAATVEALA